MSDFAKFMDYYAALKDIAGDDCIESDDELKGIISPLIKSAMDLNPKRSSV